MPSQSASGVGSCRNPGPRRTLRHSSVAQGRPLACLDARKPTPAARPQSVWAPRPSARGFPHYVEFPQQGNVTSMWKTTGYGQVTKLWSACEPRSGSSAGDRCPTVCAWSYSSLEGLTATALIPNRLVLASSCATGIDEDRESCQSLLGALAAAAITISALAIAAGYGLGNIWAIGVLAIAAAVSERQRVWIGNNTEASISLIPILFAAVLFGPLAGMVVAAVSNLGLFQSPYMKWAVYTCSRSITGGIAGFCAAGASSVASSELWAMPSVLQSVP